mmetsp:Transcript_18126/g.28662  ORF Transcript_18126/g.28662 Transcript_18126/m.28662 type:complete len:135 (+) Transcript_18126:52-456(+)|eukprot:CAMPEP_0202695600 /NCGR_PEP_ID=MMETSP1385-20130828/9165_1 /ASSEMBLY_ACC=CAM_ASM_000861 /TAXON_ID=933848 /ORGANISM="Elphidium margaritaceum" /LENGTH=134 /DNA_ID=CAMNT_0049351661 /DNA_START=58 /DNA_END=462 /DNA_ORIENTATION=+
MSRKTTSKSKAKKYKKSDKDSNRELVLKEDGQEYGQVLKMLGGGRLEAYCMDGQIRTATIRGSMQNRKSRVWINKDDFILVSLRTFENKKCDVVHKYTEEEVYTLRKKGHIPDRSIKEEEQDDDDDMDVIFENL